MNPKVQKNEKSDLIFMNKYFKQKIISLITVLVIMLLITYLNQLSFSENKKDLFVYYLKRLDHLQIEVKKQTFNQK